MSTGIDRAGRARTVARIVPREERTTVLGFAGVWLVFFGVNVVGGIIALLGEGRQSAAIAAGGIALAFTAVYLCAFLAPAPLRTLSIRAHILGYLAVLLGLTVLLAVPLGPAAAINVLPYLAAVWVFHSPLRPALAGAGVLAAAGVVAAFALVTGTQRGWVVFAVLLAIGVISVVRATTEREDSVRAVRRELELSQQREQLARDVHDVLGHSLTAVHVKAQLLRRLITADPARAEREADEIIALVRTALGDVRTTVDGLSAPRLETELAGVRRTLGDAGIGLDAPAPEDAAEVPAETADLFAWVLREAATNIVRHSGADRVRVEISPARLVVADDGVGMSGRCADSVAGAGLGGGNGGKATDAGEARSGTGLVSMSARVERAGGELSIGADRPDEARPGTRVEVTCG